VPVLLLPFGACPIASSIAFYCFLLLFAIAFTAQNLAFMAPTENKQVYIYGRLDTGETILGLPGLTRLALLMCRRATLKV